MAASIANIGFVGSWLILGSGIALLLETVRAANTVESARASSLDTTRGITITVFIVCAHAA